MSVSIVIANADGTESDVFLGGQSFMREWWCPKAKELELKWLSMWDGYCPIRKDFVNEVLDELKSFQNALVADGAMHERGALLKILDEAIAAIAKLTRTDGWKAHVG